MALCHHNQLETECPICSIPERVARLEKQLAFLIEQSSLGKPINVSDLYQKGWDDCLKECKESLKRNHINLVL